MNDMRKLINLMEGVMAVPSLGNQVSEQIFDDPLEDKLYNAVAAIYGPQIWDHDDMYKLVADLKDIAQPSEDELDQIIATGQMPPRLANFEFGTSDDLQFGSDLEEARFQNVYCSQCGRGFGPGDSGYSSCKEHEGKGAVDESHVSDGQMSNPAPAVDVLAMEDANDIESSMHPVNTIKSVIAQLHPNDTSSDAVANEVPHLARDPQYQEWHRQAEDMFYGAGGAIGDDDDDDDDYTEYTMRQGEMGNPDRAMEEDLNNGYDSVETATGSDFFPNGADSPVVKATGPSGARQGDNPEQKKMQVAEVHKELVYGYRNFLKESAKK
jgi:hypothetical protein